MDFPSRNCFLVMVVRMEPSGIFSGKVQPLVDLCLDNLGAIVTLVEFL